MAEDLDLSCNLVVDNGSGVWKVGFSEEDDPRATFPAIIGRSKYERVIPFFHSDDHFVGDYAQTMRGFLDIIYPVEHGIVSDWDGMDRLLQHAFYNVLRLSPEELPLLMTDAVLSSKSSRETMAEMLFEKFDLMAFWLANRAFLTAFASGKSACAVVNIGAGVCDITPFSTVDGGLKSHAVHRADFAGRDLTRYMMTLLNNRGFSFRTTADQDIVREMKEEVGCVAQDSTSPLGRQSPPSSSRTVNINYELPDGQVIIIGDERSRVSEPLFQPSLLGLEYKGIHELVSDAIAACDPTLRKDLYSNIILAGGSTKFSGFPERLKKEVSSLAPAHCGVKILAPAQRQNSAWLGGSVLSCLSAFRNMWITKQEYGEHGPNIINK